MIGAVKSGQLTLNPFVLEREAPASNVAPYLPPVVLPRASIDELLAQIQDGKIAALISKGDASGIDPQSISIGAIEPGMVAVDPSPLIERKIRSLEKSLFGVEAGHAAFAGRVRSVQMEAYREYLAGRERSELVRNGDLIQYHRLVDRSPADFVAGIDPSSGRIAVSEQIQPIASSTVAGASEGIAISGASAAQSSYLRGALDEIFPAAALSILGRSETKLAFAQEIGEVSPTALALFGEGCAIADLACPDLGRYWPFLGEAMIPLVPETTISTDALLSIVVHELSHALDWALGEPGHRWSESEEWKSLFAACESFPTERSRENEAELFAECAAIYLLGRHVDVQPLRDQVATRGDLPEAIFDRLERLFGAEIASMDGEGKRLSQETRRAVIEQALASAEATPLSFARSYHAAAWNWILSVVTGSSEAKERALIAVADAEARDTGDYARALRAEIER